MKMTKSLRRKRIQHRIRKKVSGVAACPRLSVYRSNSDIYCQLIDDLKGHTIAAATSRTIATDGMNKSQQAREVGKLIAQRALEAQVSKVVFDRGGYLYHGRVKELAEGAREGGLVF
jgi:large subunit ribosomal protein L18